MIYYLLGGKSKGGKKATPYLVQGDGGHIQFVMYCRQCHAGLCTKMEIGRDEKYNVIALEPHVCGDQIPYPEKYQKVLGSNA